MSRPAMSSPIAAAICLALLAAPLSAQEATQQATQQATLDQRANPEIAGETWPDLRQLIYSQRPVHDGAHFMALEAPYRAHDAAVVPIEIAIAPPPGRKLTRFSVIIDENPAPVAAVVDVGPALGRDDARHHGHGVDVPSLVALALVEGRKHKAPEVFATPAGVRDDLSEGFVVALFRGVVAGVVATKAQHQQVGAARPELRLQVVRVEVEHAAGARPHEPERVIHHPRPLALHDHAVEGDAPAASVADLKLMWAIRELDGVLSV